MKTGLFVFSEDEDGLIGFCGTLELPEDKTETYKEAVEYLHLKLSSKELVDRLIDQDGLLDDFDEKDYEFESYQYKNHLLHYTFSCPGEEPIVVKKQISFMDIF